MTPPHTPPVSPQRASTTDALPQAISNTDEDLWSAKELKKEGWGLIILGAPIAGMNLVQMLLVLSSAAFVGHLGALELASCQLATTLANATGHIVLVRVYLRDLRRLYVLLLKGSRYCSSVRELN